MEHRLAFLGIPRFISKGLFETLDGLSCRFLVMDRFHGSLEDCLIDGEFAPSDIPSIAIQTVGLQISSIFLTCSITQFFFSFFRLMP